MTGPPDELALARMVAAMRHRGPDDAGTHFDGQVALGMTRLSIFDLSEAAHQPMLSPDGRFALVYNGETFNFLEKREALRALGRSFRTRGDTEVVLELFREHGRDAVHHLRGMFAFAVWDRAEHTLTLARDRLGIKPLYYAWKRGRLVFASELKALLASGEVSEELDPEGLRQLLTLGSVQPPRTLLRDVHALLPGHGLELHDGRLSGFRYWDIDTRWARAAVAGMDLDELAGSLRDKLLESVRLRVRSDVPFGAFLSGGSDSAAIVGLMREAGVQRVRTFTIGFEEAPGAVDERVQSEATARHFDTDHVGIVVSDGDAISAFDAFARGLDQPSIDGLNTFFASELAKRHVTVALSGLGPDELFGGYSRTWQIYWNAREPASAGRALAARLSRESAGSHGLLPRRLARRLEAVASTTDPLGAYAHLRRVFGPADLRALLTRDGAHALGAARRSEAPLAPHDDPSLDLVRRLSRLDLTTFLPAQLLRDMDAVSMYHSLEVRFPFIDHEVVELAFAMPDWAKYEPPGRPESLAHAGATYAESGAKRVFLHAVRDLLPPDLLSRKKSGFLLPYGRWMRGGLGPRLDEAFERLAQRPAGLFDAGGLLALRERFALGQASWTQPWLLLMLDAWHETVLGARGAAACTAA
jgi:asparagine synthase (glutamine-hydrolysing)